MKSFIRIAPILVCIQLAGCASEGASTPAAKPVTLENTYWKLTGLGGAPVSVAKDPREPHLVLQSRDRRVDGADGCAKLRGNYLTEGSSVSFVEIASSKSDSCVAGVDNGQALQRALSGVARWRIVGRELELMNERNDTLARFEASQ
jgi:heat shock protein HslJ